MFEEYYHIEQCTGISILIGRSGELRVTACSVQKKKNELLIVKKLTGLEDLKRLPEHLPAKALVSLNISGKGVIHKRVDRLETITAENFRQLLPNADIQDFFVQHFPSGPYSFVSVIRKNEAEKWLGQLEEFGFQTIMLSLGPFPVFHLSKQLNVYGGELLFAGHMITRDEEQQWQNYVYTEDTVAPFPLKVDLEAMDETLLIPYAAAFQVVLQTRFDPVKAAAESVDKVMESQLGKKKFRLFGLFLLGFFLLILSVNAFVFSSLFAENNELEARVSTTAQNTADMSSIDNEVKEKEALLKKFGWDKGADKAIFIDRIASILPDELTLDEINVNPVDPAASRKEKSLQFKDGSIWVNGHSASILPVNEWVARIKILPWVKSCAVQNFSVNREKNTGQFTVIITF
ncbi:MAG: hypothetical protein V4456_16325 [Bacteroidota bacterium]